MVQSLSETFAINMMKTLERSIIDYSAYSAIRSDLALYLSLHERAAGNPFYSIDQQLSDEWVRKQMDKIKKSPYLYTDGLKENFLAVSQCLL